MRMSEALCWMSSFVLMQGSLPPAVTAVRMVLASAFDFTSFRRTFVNRMGLITWMRSMV